MQHMGGGSGKWGISPGKDYGALGYLLHWIGLQLQDTRVCSVSLTVEYLLRNRPLPVAREAKTDLRHQEELFKLASGDVANG